jgi:hypothetical protein
VAGLGGYVDDDEVAAVLGGPPEAVEVLTHNPMNAVTGGVWRITTADTTAVLKVLTDGHDADASPRHWQASDDPRHFNYWRREPEAYLADLASAFRPAGVDAPRLLHLEDRGDTVLLWLEDVEGYDARDWELDELVAFAGALGAAQGRIAAVGAWDRPWLSQDYLRTYSESKPFDERLFADDQAWSNPRVQHHLGPLREALTHLRVDRERSYAMAAACPRTLCHLDVWPVNLMRRLVDGSFVLLDWSFCGAGALGEDIANLVPDSVFDLVRPVEELDELAARAEDAYIDGVFEGGWDGDDRWIRLGIRAAGVKYHWLIGLLLRDAADGEGALAYGRHVDRDQLYDARAAGLRLVTRWQDEAEALAYVLGVA